MSFPKFGIIALFLQNFKAIFARINLPFVELEKEFQKSNKNFFLKFNKWKKDLIIIQQLLSDTHFREISDTHFYEKIRYTEYEVQCP